MKEPELRDAFQVLNRMETGINYDLSDLTGRQLEYIDIIQNAKNEFQMKQKKKHEQKMRRMK